MVEIEPRVLAFGFMSRMLLTWSDRGVDGPAPAHHAKRAASDRGPVMRLIEEGAQRYERALVLTVVAGKAGAERLASELREHVADVEVRPVSLDDPSDYRKLFAELGPLASELAQRETPIDVLVSAGTPQAQTIWVVLTQSAMLPARLLQVIPPAFVPVPHPKAVREVRLDIEGFPQIRSLRAEVSRLRAELRSRASRIVAESAPMRVLLDRLARIAPSELPVLILGETGSGKELLARALHDGGARASQPFVAENCGALAESVLASELFGHEAGAFTGASARHRGLFEQAHGGTLFLDEVGELPPRVQAMLLRVLQEGVLRRVGGERAVPVDVRVVAATHRDLRAMVEAGAFREDLYYRLRGAELVLPPLRERRADVPLMIKAFLDEASRPSGRRDPGRTRLTVSAEAMECLVAYAWPGNVRELRSEVQRWPLFCDERVDLADLSPEIRQAIRGAPARTSRPAPSASDVVRPLAEAVDAVERATIEHALRHHQGNLLRTAKALAIERNTLKRKMRALGLRAE